MNKGEDLLLALLEYSSKILGNPCYLNKRGIEITFLISQDFPYWVFRKKLQQSEDSGISLISFSIKSYVNFRGTGLPIKAKKEYILQGTKNILSLYYYELQAHQIYIRNKSANIMHSFIFSFFISNSFLQFQAFSLNSLFLIHPYYQKLNFLLKNHLFYKLVHKTI